MKKETEDIDEWLIAWMAFSASARNELEGIHDCKIEPYDFQMAVCETLGYERPVDMLYKKLPKISEIVDSLADYNFVALNIEVLQEIVVDEQFIPSDAPQLLEEQTINTGGYRWRIHQNDADPFPSSPHAHALGTALKLHLGTGELFLKRKLVSRIRCKHLRALREKVTSRINLPDYTCG